MFNICISINIIEYIDTLMAINHITISTDPKISIYHNLIHDKPIVLEMDLRSSGLAVSKLLYLVSHLTGPS